MKQPAAEHDAEKNDGEEHKARRNATDSIVDGAADHHQLAAPFFEIHQAANDFKSNALGSVHPSSREESS